MADSASHMARIDSLDSSCTVLLDLDDTLYDVPEVPRTVRASIVAYLRDQLGVPAVDVEATTLSLYLQHGTTLAGLVATGHVIDYDHYHSMVHGTLDYNRLIQPNGVRELLARMSASRHLFTNADAAHTRECLQRLGISECFETVWCFENMQQLHKPRAGAPPSLLCKPQRRAFEAVLAELGVTPAQTVFVDDSPRNCAAAFECGIFTVLVGREGHVPGADLVIPTIHDLPRVLPGLFAPPDAAAAEAAAEQAVAISVPA